MGVITDYVREELRIFRVQNRVSQDKFGQIIGYSGSHVSSVETGARPPTREYLEAIDRAYHTDGRFTRMIGLMRQDGEPVWLREWINVEREALTLRWYELAYIPGLLQTERYARATLTGGRFSPEEIERIVNSRLERQSVLSRERAPRIIAVIDEIALRRPASSQADLMREQCERLRELADRDHIHIHIVPNEVGMYPGLLGSLILADLPDGTRVAHADSQLRAQITDDPSEVAALTSAWEAIRAEALSQRQSRALLEEVIKAWTA